MSKYSIVDPSAGFLGGDPAGKQKIILRPKKGAAPGLPGFLAWLAATHPKAYDYVRVSVPDYAADIEGLRSGASELRGLGLDLSFDAPNPDMPTVNIPAPDTSVWSQIATAVSQAAAAYVPLAQQKKLLDLQVERARQGLPPLDTSQYESATAGVQFGVNRSTQNTVLMVAAGLGGLFLLSQLMKRR